MTRDVWLIHGRVEDAQNPIRSERNSGDTLISSEKILLVYFPGLLDFTSRRALSCKLLNMEGSSTKLPLTTPPKKNLWNGSLKIGNLEKKMCCKGKNLKFIVTLLGIYTGWGMVKWSENGFLNYNTLISLFDLLLLVNRNARDFCALILYPVTLNISLICSSNFLMVSLVFSIYSMR